MSNSEPLTEATLYILLSLTAKPLHGYAIMQQVAEMSEGRIHFSTGTLYGALKRLLEQNWIERVDDGTTEENGRIRKAYQLTEIGKSILNGEIKRLEALTALAQRRWITGFSA